MMKEKVTIEKGTVQETLMFPLFGRYKANQMYPGLFRDTTAGKIIESIDYDIEKADMGKGPQFVYGMRQDVTEKAVSDFLVDEVGFSAARLQTPKDSITA